MALAPLTPTTISPCSCACILEDHRNPTSRHAFPLSGDASRVRIGASLLGFRSRRKGFVVSVEARGRSRSSVKEFQTASVDNGGQIRSGVEVPVTCYQIIGVSDKAEKDEIVKSVMDLKGAEVEEGYTMDVVLSRQDLLMDVRDKLLFEQEYAGNPREKVPPKASLRMPWSWLPGALCLLQEVGAEKSVLEFGRAALQHPEVKPYVHDILLSMALAECTVAKIAFEDNKVSQGFEALARAQFLLKSKISLGKLPLLSQIEETLEELAPACTLELLGMPHAPENAERRRGAIAALHELLRQGLDVEASSQVQDWPCFLIQALNKLMASEIVDLVPWENLADTRRNKKSLESHNQRVVIDFACFRIAMAAHIALGFSSKQTDLVRSRSCLYYLVQSSCTECLKLEDAFCSFLLGQGSEAAVADILRQIEINSGHASLDGRLGPYHLGPAEIEQEIWLKDAVLGLFPDTRNCSPKLAYFFVGEKRILRGTRHTKETSRSPTLNHRPSAVLPPECASSDERVPHLSSPRHFGTAVKQLAPSSLQSPLTAVKASNVSSGAASSKLNPLTNAFSRLLSLLPRGLIRNMSGSVLIACARLSAPRLGVSVHSCIAKTGLEFDRNLVTWNAMVDGYAKCGDMVAARETFELMPERDVVSWSSLIDGYVKDGNYREALGVFMRMRVIGAKANEVTMVSVLCACAHLAPVLMEGCIMLVWQTQVLPLSVLYPTNFVLCLSMKLSVLILAKMQQLQILKKGNCHIWIFYLILLCVVRRDMLTCMYNESHGIITILSEVAFLSPEIEIHFNDYLINYFVQKIIKKKLRGTMCIYRWHVKRLAEYHPKKKKKKKKAIS
ncbi:hypothetical protein Scep_015951 [Stephania cephalantha]|uniref:Plastid division protein CDP1-like 1st alpha solenoid domain-containing protein n=1 Tax=Stephania cephalantha TaxID=152367 RepID=A0AAP0IMW3_9MAGN